MPQGRGWSSGHRNGSCVSVEFGLEYATNVMSMYVLPANAVVGR